MLYVGGVPETGTISETILPRKRSVGVPSQGVEKSRTEFTVEE